MRKLLLSLGTCLLCVVAQAQTITSPDGKLKVVMSDNEGLTFSIADGEKVLVKNVSLGLDIRNGKKTVDVSKAKVSGKPALKTVKEDIVAPNYRQAKFSVKYNHAVVKLNCGVNVEFKVFDEGVAYRYVTTGMKGEYQIVNEKADIAFAGDYV